MSGTLYLVATPIGNLEDITLRALRVLREADLVAAEDTRRSLGLLAHFEIKKPLISYYEHNKRLREQELLDLLRQGKNIALITDAGTPALSDPGADLAAAALAAGLPVVAVPGASALLTALAMSGWGGSPFCFEGFLARDRTERRRRLRELADERRVMAFYEAPHRLSALLEDMEAVFGADRRLVLCRELTKLHEEQLRSTVAELRQLFQKREPRGEFVVLAAGAPEAAAAVAEPERLSEAMEELLDQGLSRKEAARSLAEQYGLRVKDVYDLGLRLDKQGL